MEDRRDEKSGERASDDAGRRDNAVGGDDGGDRRPPSPHSDAPSPWEWIFGTVGLLLVLATLGFLVYEATTSKSTPPAIEIEVDSIEPAGDLYVVRIRVVNRGETTAEGLTVKGALVRGGESVEETETVFDYAPSRSERVGGLFFTQDPRQYELRIRPIGYEEP